MQFMANGRSALIIISGVWLCLAAPAGAQQADTSAPDAAANAASDPNTESAADAPVVPNKPVKPRAKKPVAAQLQQTTRVARSKKADDAQGLRDDSPTGSIPPAVSNAKAQFGAGGTLSEGAQRTTPPQPDNTLNMTRQADPAAAPADAPAANPDGVVAASQPNDTDRAMSQGAPYRERPVLATAAMQTPYAASGVDSTWGRTSLIGKIFVAVGGLLTLASAARMFIA